MQEVDHHFVTCFIQSRIGSEALENTSDDVMDCFELKNSPTATQNETKSIRKATERVKNVFNRF